MTWLHVVEAHEWQEVIESADGWVGIVPLLLSTESYTVTFLSPGGNGSVLPGFL